MKEYEFCLRCGRKLKNPEARAKGYGVVCEHKRLVECERRLFDVGCNLQSSPKNKDLH